MEEALSLEQRVTPPRLFLQDPPYLVENWKAILGAEALPPQIVESSMILVVDGVASILNPHIIVRCQLPVPDGCYHIGPANELLPLHAEAPVKDPGRIRPHFQAMSISQQIPRIEVHKFLNFISEVRQSDISGRLEGKVYFDETSVICRSDPRLQFRFTGVGGQLIPLPVRGEPVLVDAKLLKLALTEMLRYDSIVIAYENRLDRFSPVFFGQNWDGCALVSPLSY